MMDKSLEDSFYIKSNILKKVEPWLVEYFDYDSSMLIDKIQIAIETKCKLGDYIFVGEDGIPTIDYLKCFYNNESFAFNDFAYSHKNGIAKTTTYKDLSDEFPEYFDFEEPRHDNSLNHYLIYISLSYMAYIYHRQKNGDFNTFEHPLIQNIDFEYQTILHKKIYPEMLSLYKMILESKKRFKKQGDVISVNYKGDKLDINTSGWFIEDMEKYFKDRFPNLTLEKIEELLPQPQKGGRKSKDPYTMIMIWGAYQLMKNYHSSFKDSKVAISKEICEFILNYLDFCHIDNDFVDTDIKDNLKDMLKRGYSPKWNLPWRNVFSNIEEIQPDSELEKLNQAPRKYDLSNLL